MSENAFGGFLKALGELSKDPTFRREAIKTGFKVGGGAVLGAGGLWVWNKKRKVTKKDEKDAEDRKQRAKEQDRQKELKHAAALEAIKTQGVQDRKDIMMGIRSSKTDAPTKPKRTTPSQSTTFAGISQNAGSCPSPIIPGILYPGDMCLLAGENHTGKSILMYHIGLCLAEGKPLNITEGRDFTRDKYEVIFYDRENSDRVLIARYGNLAINNFRIIRGRDFVTIDDLLDDLELQLENIPAGSDVLLCIDNATAFKMPTSGPRITDFYTRLQGIIDDSELKRINLTAIIAAHLSSSATSKKDDARVLGATQLISGASANLYIKNTRFGKQKKILKATKNRIGNYPDDVILLRVIDEAPWHFEFERMMKEVDALPLKDGRSESSSVSPKKASGTGASLSSSKQETPSTKERDPRRTITDEEIKMIIQRKNAGERIEDIAKEKGTSMKTLYKWINKYREEHPDE